MSSQTLTTRAVIQGVDNLTGPLSKMGGGVRNFAMQSQKHLDTLQRSYGAFASKIGSMPVIGGGLAAALGVGHLTKDLVEYDRKARQVRALNTMSEREFSQHQARWADLTDKYGISPEKVLHAAEAYQQLTGSMKGFDQVAQVAAKTSRITGTEMAEQVKEVNSLARAFGMDATQKHNIEEIERVYLVAAKGMMGGAHAFGAAMKSFAPVAATIGLDLGQASAMVQMLGGQFEGGEIGTALKTIGLRIAAPKDPALRALSAQGVSPLMYMDIDAAKVAAGGEGLSKALAAGGFDVKGKDLSKLFAGLDLSTFEGKREFDKRYMAEMSGLYGKAGKKGGTKFQGQDRLELMEIERQFLGGLGSRINVEKFLAALAPFKNNPQVMQRLFGTEHVAKGRDLLAQAEHYVERRNHIFEAAHGRRYVHTKGTGTLTGADAIDQRSGIVADPKSISYQYDRMMGNMQTFWQRTWGAVGGGMMTSAFKAGGDFFRAMQRTDPRIVQGVTAGMVGLAALPVGVFALSQVGKALGVMKAVGMAPLRMMGALNAMPFAVTAAGMTKMGAATRLMGASTAGNALMGMGRFVGFLGSIARFSGMGLAVGGLWYAAEHFDDIAGAFKNFGATDAGKGLTSSLSKLWDTAKGLGSDIVKASDGLLKLLGWKPEGDAKPEDTLATMAGWAKKLTDWLESALTALRALFNPDIKPPEWVRWSMEQNNAEAERILSRGQPGQYDWPKSADELVGKVDKPLLGEWDLFGLRSGGDWNSRGLPDAFPDGAFNSATRWPHSDPLTGDAGGGINLDPIVVSQGEVREAVVDAKAAIVTELTRLGPAMASALASAVARSSAGFGAPANAGQPSAGNATGRKP